MPLKQIKNTEYPPIKIKDLIVRGNNTGILSIIPEAINQQINDQWIYYLMQTDTYMLKQTDMLTAYIFQNFKERVLLDRYSDMFTDWKESEDFETYAGLLEETIKTTLIGNKEKYRKIFEAQFLKFHPEWNVDGEEITERTLNQTGNVTDEKTGNDSTTRTGNETDEKTGTESNTRTGSESNTQSGSTTETTAKTSYDSNTFYDAEKVTTEPNQAATTTQYNNVKDETSFTGRKDTHTYNTVKDKTDYDSTNTNTRNLQDVERTVFIRHGNIGVVSTVKLLQEYIQLAEEVNFLDIVARDVVNSISYLTY